MHYIAGNSVHWAGHSNRTAASSAKQTRQAHQVSMPKITVYFALTHHRPAMLAASVVLAVMPLLGEASEQMITGMCCWTAAPQTSLRLQLSQQDGSSVHLQGHPPPPPSPRQSRLIHRDYSTLAVPQTCTDASARREYSCMQQLAVRNTVSESL